MAGLLSLPGPVAGLLAPGVEGNARNAALMQVAAALLQAGGPNMRPTSPGQALGAAVPAAMATYQNTINSGVQQGLLGRQIEQQDAQAAREAQQRQAMQQYVSSLPPDQQALAGAYGGDFGGYRADELARAQAKATQDYRNAQLALSRAGNAQSAQRAQIELRIAEANLKRVEMAASRDQRDQIGQQRVATAAAMGGMDMAGNPVDQRALLMGTNAGREAAVNQAVSQAFPQPGKGQVIEIYDPVSGQPRKVNYDPMTGQTTPIGGMKAQTPPPQQAPPALVQEYKFAAANGYGGSFTDFIQSKRGPGVTVNTGTKIPAGYEMLPDGSISPLRGSPQAREADAATAKVRAALDVIDKLKNHPGREAGTGFTAVFPAVPGTARQDFDVLLEQAKGQVFLQAYESLKGGGQITEVEGKKAEQALARLNATQSESAFLSALNDLEAIIKSAARGLGTNSPPPRNSTADLLRSLNLE